MPLPRIEPPTDYVAIRLVVAKVRPKQNVASILRRTADVFPALIGRHFDQSHDGVGVVSTEAVG
ncbi:MAG TPA: hypothetical protein VD994_04575 [Prosthecobacter sp.]|nr:hypothetical protein [Prosthecobacter sp.]